MQDRDENEQNVRVLACYFPVHPPVNDCDRIKVASRPRRLLIRMCFAQLSLRKLASTYRRFFGGIKPIDLIRLFLCLRRRQHPRASNTSIEVKARCRGLRGHLGGGLGGAKYEGVGWSNQSAQSAIQTCCYWGTRPVSQIGVARGRDGCWYACVLYR